MKIEVNRGLIQRLLELVEIERSWQGGNAIRIDWEHSLKHFQDHEFIEAVDQLNSLYPEYDVYIEQEQEGGNGRDAPLVTVYYVFIISDKNRYFELLEQFKVLKESHRLTVYPIYEIPSLRLTVDTKNNKITYQNGKSFGLRSESKIGKFFMKLVEAGGNPVSVEELYAAIEGSKKDSAKSIPIENLKKSLKKKFRLKGLPKAVIDQLIFHVPSKGYKINGEIKQISV